MNISKGQKLMELVNLEFYEKELNQSYRKMEFTKTEKEIGRAHV